MGFFFFVLLSYELYELRFCKALAVSFCLPFASLNAVLNTAHVGQCAFPFASTLEYCFNIESHHPAAPSVILNKVARILSVSIIF